MSRSTLGGLRDQFRPLQRGLSRYGPTKYALLVHKYLIKRSFCFRFCRSPFFFVLLVISFHCLALGQTIGLSVGSATVAAGGSTLLNLSLTESGGAQPAGLEWALGYSPANVSSITVTAGAAATSAGKTIACSTGTGGLTCLLYGVNSAPISNGVVAQIAVNLSPTTTSTSTAIQIGGTVAVSSAGSAIPTSGSGGVVSILRPAIGLGSSSLTFNGASGSAVAAQSLALTNSGAASTTLNWKAISNQSWLSVSLASGQYSTGVTGNVGVSVSTSGLAPGTYQGILTFSDPSALNSPQTVTVTLTLTPPPVVTLSTTSASFSGTTGAANPAGQSVNISNTGGGTLNWTASKTQSWLTLSAGSGTAPSSLGLSVSTAGLSSGTYTDTVAVSASGASGSPQMVSVTLKVSPPPSTAFITGETLGTLRNDYTGWVGMQFRTGSNPLTVTGVGRIVAPGDGGTHTVKIVNASTGQDVPGASAAAATAGGTVGSYVYGTVNSVVLNANTAYYILTQETAGGDPWYDLNTAVQTTNAGNPISAAYFYVSSYYTLASSGTSYGPVNFQYQQVSSPIVTVGSAASFLQFDTSTMGSWEGVYGADGQGVEGDLIRYPSYAQVTISNAQMFTWAASSPDVRALQKVSNPGDRIAATWYSSTNFSIDVNLTDGLTHQVALYALDWDDASRIQRVDVIDATSQGILDSRTQSNFRPGEYLVWNVQGHVTFRVTNLGNGNGLVSGIFFGAK